MNKIHLSLKTNFFTLIWYKIIVILLMKEGKNEGGH